MNATVAVCEPESYLTAGLERLLLDQTQIRVRWFPRSADLLTAVESEVFHHIIVDTRFCKTAEFVTLCNLPAHAPTSAVISDQEFELGDRLRELGFMSVLDDDIPRPKRIELFAQLVSQRIPVHSTA